MSQIVLPSDFPVDVRDYRHLSFQLSAPPSSSDKEQLKTNIQIVRDLIIFCTALANAKGVGGHTGGPYDITPEDEIVAAFINGEPDKIHHEVFEDAGHRAMLRYIRAALNGRLDFERLLHYREHGSGLYGHPERDDEQGIWSSTGRLGHDSAQANGVAERVQPKKVVLFGSDGAMQEGINAEAARYATAHELPVIWLVDYNDVTIEDQVSRYLPQFNPVQTLRGHGWQRVVLTGNAENIDKLHENIAWALSRDEGMDGPCAVINERTMIPGIPELEGTAKAHDVISVPLAIQYLEQRGHTAAVKMLQETKKPATTYSFSGSSSERASNRSKFGEIVVELLEKRIAQHGPAYESRFLVVSNDLGGSCGLAPLQKRFPERYRSAIMESHNFMLAAGFGREKGHQAIYGTFSAFLEMIVSQITMARMNGANVLAHFSHAGVDDMADNECHFGTNIFFADCGPESDETTRLYFPADALQMRAVLHKIYDDAGLRFVFSTRSSVPYILDAEGRRFFDPKNGYEFEPDKDEVIRTGTAGYIVSYGEMLYRCLDAVERLHREGISVGLVNKPTLNVCDTKMLEEVGRMPFALVVESQNRKTGLGVRYGAWLQEQGLMTTYDHLGAVRGGAGGLEEQIAHQGLDHNSIYAKAMELHEIATQ